MVTFSQIGKHGEFGNQLFQIAATLGHAVRSKQDCVFPKWKGLISGEEYARSFLNPIKEDDELLRPTTLYHEPHFHYSEIPIVPKGVDLFGYFQSEKYFTHCSELIRQAFLPSDSFRHLNALNYSNTVAVQLRFYDNTRPYGTHGLVLDPEAADFYCDVGDNMDYFKQAINYFGKDKTYFVVTNNSPKAKHMFATYPNFYVLDNYGYLEQFFIQTKCENNIISNSSFGWWGAWLNPNPEKTVFAPQKWFKTDTKDTRDLYPNGWRIC